MAVKLRGCCIVWSCFLVRILTGGFWNSLGIFLLEWQDYFNTSATTIGWLGSIFCIVLWTSTPIASAISHQCSFRANTMVGGFIATCFLLATSLLAHTLPHIFITFGLLSFGLGLAVLSVQSVLIFNFDAHLGLASGLANTGAGFGTFLMPPLFQYLLDTYGWRGCMLISSAIYANISVCGGLLRPTQAENCWRTIERTENDKCRRHTASMVTIDQYNGDPKHNNTKHTQNRTDIKATYTEEDRYQNECTVLNILQKGRNFMLALGASFDCSLFYTNLSFILFCVVALLSGMCYSTPLIYIFAKAVDDGLTRFNAALLSPFIGIASILGRILAGIMIDYNVLKPSKLSAVFYLLCGLFTLLFPIGHNFAVLAIIAFAFGLTSGVYNSLIIFIAKEFTGLNKTTGALAWYLVIYGFGTFAGIYFSGYMKDVAGHYHASFLAAGGISVLCAIVLLKGPLLHTKHCKMTWKVEQETSAV